MHLPNNHPNGSEFTGGLHRPIMNAPEPDFSEFMWMAEEDLEAFDQRVITEVASTLMDEEEEEFLQQMLKEEEERDTVYYEEYGEHKLRSNATSDLSARMQKMGMQEDVVAKSTLNPHAAEFVPGQFTPRQNEHKKEEKKST